MSQTGFRFIFYGSGGSPTHSLLMTNSLFLCSLEDLLFHEVGENFVFLMKCAACCWILPSEAADVLLWAEEELIHAVLWYSKIKLTELILTTATRRLYCRCSCRSYWGNQVEQRKSSLSSLWHCETRVHCDKHLVLKSTIKQEFMSVCVLLVNAVNLQLIFCLRHN